MKETENYLFDFISRYMPLGEAEKIAIRESAVFRNYQKGELLLKQGQHSKDGYFVIKGCIRCYYVIEGEEKTTAFYTESETLSPLCSINQLPSEYYVSCVEDSLLLVSNPQMEKIMFEKFPRFESLCRILSEALLAKNQTSFANFKTSTPEQRYVNLLHTRPDLLQRVPQYQLASYLGITPESLSRMRTRLARRNK